MLVVLSCSLIPGAWCSLRVVRWCLLCLCVLRCSLLVVRWFVVDYGLLFVFPGDVCNVLFGA